MCCCSPTGRPPDAWVGFSVAFVKSVILAACGLKRGEAQYHRLSRTILHPDNYVDLPLVERHADRVRTVEIVKKSAGLPVHLLLELGKRLKPERLRKPGVPGFAVGENIVCSESGRRGHSVFSGGETGRLVQPGYCESRLILTRKSGADMMRLIRRFFRAKMTLAILRCLA